MLEFVTAMCLCCKKVRDLVGHEELGGFLVPLVAGSGKSGPPKFRTIPTNDTTITHTGVRTSTLKVECNALRSHEFVLPLYFRLLQSVLVVSGEVAHGIIRRRRNSLGLELRKIGANGNLEWICRHIPCHNSNQHNTHNRYRPHSRLSC